jgi:predicted nucleotidyltransferase
VASIPDLIALKTKAGRSKDLEDIRALLAILAYQENRG